MFRSKPLEERVVAAIRSELAGQAADLEERRREYRYRLESKKEARAALENAEAETRRLHSARVALKKGFWEAYYGNSRATGTDKIDSESESLEHAIEEAEKSRKGARARFEEANFDEDEECLGLIAKANMVEEETGCRIDALEEALEDLIAGLRRDLKEASRALREECQDAREVGAPKPAGDPQTPARSPWRRSMSRMGGLWTSASKRGNLPIAAFSVLVGLFCAWIGLFEIKGEVLPALVLVGVGFMNVATATLYALPTLRPRALTRARIASISLTLGVIGLATWTLLI